MEYSILLLVMLIVFAIQAQYSMKKLETKQKELQWRIESIENPLVRSEHIP